MVMYNSINNILLNKLSGKVSKVPLKKIWRLIVAYENLIRAMEHIGIEIAQGYAFIQEEDLTDQGLIRYLQSRNLARDYIIQTKIFLPIMTPIVEKAEKGLDFQIYSALKDQYIGVLINKKPQSIVNITEASFYKMSTSYIQKLT
ncbi:uncharacterized protein LOC111711494, partial [Eurytemora carolleeae]|uniref:uncharacterized protein LOC111711494 n=1 Tax=Eurytemora carolleeae TaxID=1294199 RepID=UPI000C76822E